MKRRFALALGLLTGLPLLAGWVIARTMMHPRPRVEDHGLDDFDLPAEDVTFAGRDGTRLAGWFIPAREPGPRPGIVLSHGWARSRAELLPHADFLHRAGFGVLMFDYRHRGESDGDAITMAVREQDDLHGAIDTLAARPEVDGGRIGVLGMSMGGVVAILVAAEAERVRALWVEAPYGSFDALMTRALPHYSRLPAFPFAAVAKWHLERQLDVSIDGHRPRDVIRSLSPRPLFVVADERDAVVGADETQRLFSVAAEPKQLWLIPGADHARGWQAAPEEYERRAVAFFQEAFAGPVGAPVEETVRP